MEKPHDRIVILGRRRAGKTVFLARLYHQLWKSPGRLHMRALSGESHVACMEAIEELKADRWPASTLGSQYSDIEITHDGIKRLLVTLDYPGEVFRRAFVENTDSEDVRELLDHIDRAVAAIVLLDPAVIQSESVSESVDDDYGMVQAVHRIREWTGGQDIPVVIVFTKCDVHKRLLQNEGGLKGYVSRHYVNLVREIGRFKVFASAAVIAKSAHDGQLLPDLTQPAIGVVEPLEYCLNKLAEHERADHERAAREQRIAAYRHQLEQQHRDRRRSILFWSIFWSVALVVLGAIAIVTWILAQGVE